VAVTGFTDIHTAYTTTLFNVTQGNPNLVPEVSRTYTVGTVWTPEFLSGLTMSLDYYRIHMHNAIGQVIPTNNTVQNLCEGSGGTSPYCALYQRPLPFSDHSIANFPTRIFTLNLNTASVQTEGFDFEANYGWQMSDLVSDWKGSWTARLLATYQPVLLQSVAFPGAPSTRSPDPHTRFTGFLSYGLDDWTLGLEDRWVSGFSLVAGPVTAIANNWVDPHVRSWNTVDLNISRNFEMVGTGMTGYFVVQNLFNAPPDYVPNGTIGQIYPVFYSNYNGVQDPMGRTFTIGIRADL
jgi:outer membrane receptor protein involved in Fe transport